MKRLVRFYRELPEDFTVALELSLFIVIIMLIVLTWFGAVLQPLQWVVHSLSALVLMAVVFIFVTRLCASFITMVFDSWRKSKED